MHYRFASPHFYKELNFTQDNTIRITSSYYNYSLYPGTIKDWNNLPINIIESKDLGQIYLFT